MISLFGASKGILGMHTMRRRNTWYAYHALRHHTLVTLLVDKIIPAHIPCAGHVHMLVSTSCCAVWVLPPSLIHDGLCTSTTFHPYPCCTQSFSYTALSCGATDMHDTLRRIALVKCGKHLSSPCILHMVMPMLGTKLDHACATYYQHQLVMTEHLSTFLARWLV